MTFYCGDSDTAQSAVQRELPTVNSSHQSVPTAVILIIQTSILL